MDGQEVKLHSVEIRLEAQAVRNCLNFTAKYTGKNPDQLIKSQILSITFVADNGSSDTGYLLNTPWIWQEWLSEH